MLNILAKLILKHDYSSTALGFGLHSYIFIVSPRYVSRLQSLPLFRLSLCCFLCLSVSLNLTKSPVSTFVSVACLSEYLSPKFIVHIDILKYLNFSSGSFFAFATVV